MTLSAQRFGSFLLFKRLGRDALGHTFRAGKLEEGAVARIVLLRTFDDAGIDGARLWSRSSKRRKFGKEARVQLRILVGIGGQALKVEHVGPNAGRFRRSCRASGPLR